ncbi:MAG: hypothetical protein AB3A66_01800 [Nodularia sp. CChRGM 3473]
MENSDSFAQNIIDKDALIKTRKLLDQAIVQAYYAVKSERRPPERTYTRWVWRLAGAYYSSCYTSQLMEKAAQKFAALGRQYLAQWAAQKAREEAGHDQLALLDIRSMGYNPEAVVQALIPSTIRDYINYFTQIVETSNPIDCIGLCYASERLGTFVGEDYIQRVEALLPPGINATRWLRVHSNLGSEVKHVDDTLKLLARLTPQEFTRVKIACYETALLRFIPPKGDYISDEELQGILKPLKLSPSLQAKSAF